MSEQPLLYVPYLTPSFVLDKEAGNPFRELGASLTPKGILVISPRWETPTPCLGTTSDQRLLLDFPDPTKKHLRLVYPAARAPQLADAVLPFLRQHYPKAHQKRTKQLDFAAWGGLFHLFPSALTPVLQLSIPKDATVDELLQFGKHLSALGKQNILVVATGNMPSDQEASVLTAIDNQDYSASYLTENTDAKPLLIVCGSSKKGHHHTPGDYQGFSTRSLLFS